MGSQLTWHSKIHNDAEPYKCKESGQIFSHHSFFAEQKIHNDENLYQWKDYGNTTSHDCDLAQHQNIYTFEKYCDHKDFEMAFSPMQVILGSGRSSGGGNGNLLLYSCLYSCLENPMYRKPDGLESMGLQRVGHD